MRQELNVKGEANEYLDDFIRGSSDCLDRRVHCVSRGRRADPSSACARRDLAYSAFRDGHADNLNRNPSDSTAEFMAERRQEQRARKDLTVQVSGRAANGDAFSQSVIASNISNGGALLSGLSSAVRSGDLVWVEYQGRMARYRIVWVRDSDSDLKSQAAVQKLDTEECPWAISGTRF